MTAFDTDGQAWGLVTRYTRLPDSPVTIEPGTSYPPVRALLRAGRIDHVRWVKFDALPFAEDERVTPEGWTPTPRQGRFG